MQFQLPIKLIAFGALFAVFATGVFKLTDYSSRPGDSGNVPFVLPDSDDVDAVIGHPGQLQIILFYHPKCPCTFATARCLERLSPRFSSNPKFRAYAFCPLDEQDSWIQSRTTQKIEKIENSSVAIDRGGKICQQMGVRVSGHILVYDHNNQLIFSGGITPYRGHEGDCNASMDFVAKVNGEQNPLSRWPVFGCPFFEEAE